MEGVQRFLLIGGDYGFIEVVNNGVWFIDPGVDDSLVDHLREIGCQLVEPHVELLAEILEAEASVGAQHLGDVVLDDLPLELGDQDMAELVLKDGGLAVQDFKEPVVLSFDVGIPQLLVGHYPRVLNEYLGLCESERTDLAPSQYLGEAVVSEHLQRVLVAALVVVLEGPLEPLFSNFEVEVLYHQLTLCLVEAAHHLGVTTVYLPLVLQVEVVA